MNALEAQFNLSTVFNTLAAAVPDREVLVWRDLRLTYADMNARIDGVAHHLSAIGLGCHTERSDLRGHESGQDHLGIYLRNGNEYLESMIGAYRARVAPFNVSYRYVEEELIYLLHDASAAALVYHAEFAPRVAAIRGRLPHLKVLIQVADDSGNDLLPGAVDYESIITTPVPDSGMPTPTGDDLYVLYTGGTTGMPKAVLWRQHDIFLSSMGGRPMGRNHPLGSYQELAEQACASTGFSLLVIPPFMHAAAQWATFFTMTRGGLLVIPDDVDGFRPAAVLRLAHRERIFTIPIVGDAIGRPLVEELESGDYDLPDLVSIANAAAPLTPTVRDRILTALPHVVLSDGVGSSETGIQMMSAASAAQMAPQTATFNPQFDTAVVNDDFSRVLNPGEGEGWLARRDLIPLGYLKDEAKTARTYPTIDGTRWSVPGDRARILDDGRIELLGRDSVTINSGGEKIFVEEVERAIASHPAVYDVVVVGRPSERWGSEVVAVVQMADNQSATDDDLADTCALKIARYKIPKAFIRVDKVMRSPAGKADYRWAKTIATDSS
ncbi:acyl-CoA synthetase [Mycolicibacterium setense]|uniref:acyl-CoA synthetase n=1 Tax=Mycolicibacterium setense TaxID=431269 RepID=UPI000574CC14|nr:acyl-CoA synthetase [Mycolicibacterium setense]KHO22080.1 acyl-CoA synthetase [Mycolicibacterium setense]MCV7113684.1 acyl-CoA synthetase [Mycolicibacterium setense]